jgi:hypothetical protein
VGVGVGLVVGEEALDSTYATRNTSTQTHTKKKISFLLPIVHFH